MKYFDFIDNKKDIFYRVPEEFSIFSDKATLSYCLGATLYMSGLRKNLINDIKRTTSSSVVICLEDAVASDKLDTAEKNVFNLFRNIESISKGTPDFLTNIPLIFLRVRNYAQFRFLLNNSSLEGLCGFVFPKFEALQGERYLETLQSYNRTNNRSLYALPILETLRVIHKSSRINELQCIKELLDSYRDIVLNVRIGGTDFSGLYGLRRSKIHTIYDLSVINDCIGDIINIFKIDDYVISAPVNEYFSFDEDLESSGFIKEINLDKVNGLIGKTVIHPSQVDIVNSIMAVSKEDYIDANSILASSGDGVIRSLYSNKMNEVKPHLLWAKQIIRLSNILGVLNNGKSYKDILSYSNGHQYKRKLEGIIEY